MSNLDDIKFTPVKKVVKTNNTKTNTKSKNTIDNIGMANSTDENSVNRDKLRAKFRKAMQNKKNERNGGINTSKFDSIIAEHIQSGDVDENSVNKITNQILSSGMGRNADPRKTKHNINRMLNTKEIQEMFKE
jgi:hypothetical protein